MGGIKRNNKTKRMNHILTEVFNRFPAVPTAKVWEIHDREGIFVSDYDPVLDTLLPEDMFCVFTIGLTPPYSLILPGKLINDIKYLNGLTYNILHPPKDE